MTRRYAPITSWIVLSAILVSTFASLTFNRSTAKPNPYQLRPIYPTLARYATDLTLKALEGKLEATRDRETDVARVIASLAAAGKTPVVVGESDFERDAIARGVALKIAFGDVPDGLRGKRVFRLSLDALAKGAKSSEEFVSRVQAVFAEASQAADQIILFVDQLHQYAGSRAATTASVTVKEAIQANHLRIIGGVSPAAYATYIASDESVAKLFESISIDPGTDGVAATEAQNTDKRRSPIDEEFVGENISPDMRELMKSGGPNGKVNAILQVSDVNNSEIRSLLARHGVVVNESMAKLGAMKVELPVQAIEALMKSRSMNYISPDRQMQSFGHVTSTTGAEQARNAPGLISGLLGAAAVDGSGIGIAVLDSGVDTGHMAFLNTALIPSSRIKYSKDFTSENNSGNDPYGHGSHVAAAAAGHEHQQRRFVSGDCSEREYH